MNISYSWLRALAPSIDDTPEQVAARLGMLGAPVDEVVALGAELGDVVIARVEAVREHPNADRLRLCTVNAGGDALQVVCGAPNVEAGRFYPFAPVGASLPGGIQIRRAKLRGEVSEGMLCSAREIGLGREHQGLMTLGGEWEPGAPLVATLGLEDVRLVLDVTPNRPDLLSHFGVAGELAPGGRAAVRLPELPGADAAQLPLRGADGEREGETAGVGVAIAEPELCPRYLAAVVRGVRVGPSPEWLATRLRAIGVRPINNVVDATNYVLHELGQPLHAFDLARLAGPRIRVRRASAGETLRTLDGVERTLGTEMLVIADAEGPVALAGVMGGEHSEVTQATRDVLIECALFDAKAVRGTARGLGLSTDASHRFERGVDPQGAPRALERVVQLIRAVAGGALDGTAVDVRPATWQPLVLPLRPARVEQLLGMAFDADRIRALLEPIGFGVLPAREGAGAPLQLQVPGFRPDVTREVDVVEEIARRHGYDAFPEQMAAFRPSRVPADPVVRLQEELRARLAGRGLLEARTAAFAPASDDRVPLLNPLSAEESHLRDRLLPGLLRRLEHNWAHGVRDVRLFEIGTVFFPTGGGVPPAEEVRVAAVLSGARRPPHWSEEREALDVWDLKALLSELGGLLDAELDVELDAGDDAERVGVEGAGEQLAAGERLSLRRRDGEWLGRGGRVAEGEVDAPAWADPVWALELRLRMPESRPRVYRPLPEFPAVERDLALLLPTDLPAARVEEVIRAAAGPLLDEVAPFDVYQGKGVPEGQRSVAWRLRFRAPDRTLTDDEVDAAVQRVLDALQTELGVVRR